MWKNKKIRILITGCLCLLLLIGVAVGILLTSDSGDETVYREAQVEYGELTVGLQESGNVTVGTTEQTFDLDLSAYTSGSDSSFSWEQGGGLFQGMMGTTSSTSSSSSSSRTLQVEEVLVTKGQEISEGDAIYRLSSESLNSIREELSSDVSDAQVTLAQTQTQQQLTSLEAEQTLTTDTAYGSLADAEYNSSVQSLQDAVTDIEEQITDLTEELAELNVELAEYQADLESEKEALESGEYVVTYTDIVSDAYGWITAENAREEAAEVVESLEDSIEETTDSIEEKTKELEEAQNSLTGAQRDLELGLISAQAQLDTRKLRAQNASERYQVNVELSDFNVQVAQEDYDDAQAKLDEFDSVLDGETIRAGYNGVVTEVSLEEGDTVNTGNTLIVLNDYDDVTVSVSVEESELANISEGDEVNVSIASYPDEKFTGEVEDIGDSTYNSSTGVTYVEITIKLGGDTSKLYEGMTAEITFITKETEVVLYIPNRAVYRENGKSYVKKKETDGTITQQEIVTGFSDGTNVEITEGLSEGETVLIESKVSD